MKYQLQHIWQQVKSLLSFEWEQPLFLYLLVLPFLLFTFKYWIQGKKRAKLMLHLNQELPNNPITFLQSYLPYLLQAACIWCLVIALAGPFKNVQYIENKAEGINIAIGLDISSSMSNKDVSPSRLEVAKEMAYRFIQKRIGFDAVSIVAFAGEPNLVSPITQDSTYLLHSIKNLKAGLIAEEGTALGDAMGTCINQLRELNNPKKIGIIISDGNNTAGNLDPAISSRLARIFNIKFYTIAVGVGRSLADPVDEETLRNIAKNTNGTFFRANDSSALSAIFSEIDALEKTKIKTYRRQEHIDQSRPFIALAIFFFLLNLALKLTWIGNIFED